MDVETLAKILHEAGRAAVLSGKTLKPMQNERFLEWDEITDAAREGRRIQSRYLLDRFNVTEKNDPK